MITPYRKTSCVNWHRPCFSNCWYFILILILVVLPEACVISDRYMIDQNFISSTLWSFLPASQVVLWDLPSGEIIFNEQASISDVQKK